MLNKSQEEKLYPDFSIHMPIIFEAWMALFRLT